MILKIPGIGLKSAKMIMAARKFANLGREHLEKIGVVLKRAQYFITYPGRANIKDIEASLIKSLIMQKSRSKFDFNPQLNLFS